MELLKYILPSEVVSKVRLYHSHPVADIIKPVSANIVIRKVWLCDYRRARERYRILYNKELFLDAYWQESWKNNNGSCDFGYFLQMTSLDFHQKMLDYDIWKSKR